MNSTVDFRERSLLMFLFIISVKVFEDLCNYPVMINPALTDGLLVKKSDRSVCSDVCGRFVK